MLQLMVCWFLFAAWVDFGGGHAGGLVVGCLFLYLYLYFFFIL